MGLLDFVKKLFGGGADARDRGLRCMQCGKDFVFEWGEQEFFKEKGFQDPKRCPVCRKEGRGRSRGRRR